MSQEQIIHASWEMLVFCGGYKLSDTSKNTDAPTFNRYAADYCFPSQDDYSMTLEALQFDVNWQWLMEVVAQIERLGYDVSIGTDTFDVFDELGELKLFVGRSGRTKLEMVFEGCALVIANKMLTKKKDLEM